MVYFIELTYTHGYPVYQKASSKSETHTDGPLQRTELVFHFTNTDLLAMLALYLQCKNTC